MVPFAGMRYYTERRTGYAPEKLCLLALVDSQIFANPPSSGIV